MNFRGSYNDFDSEKKARKIFDEYIRKILYRANQIERINNGLYRKLDVIKYDPDPAVFIENALSPAKDLTVAITDPKKSWAARYLNKSKIIYL